MVWFFYPETAYRSLEEMDTIFAKTKNIFSVVETAKTEPRRYGKNGEVLINYNETEEHFRRRSSAGERRASRASLKAGASNLEHVNAGYEKQYGK